MRNNSHELRLGNKKEKKCFFILYCSHLSLSLNKIGCGSEKSKIKTAFFICLFTRLVLSLNKTGCGSAIKKKKLCFFILYCSRLFFKEDKLHLSITFKHA